MPIGPNEIAFSYDEADKVIAKVDAALRDPAFIRHSRQGKSTNPFWTIVESGELTPEEKDYITNVYLRAGWGDVKVRNSSENGERGGLCSITLYKQSQPHPYDH